MKKQFLISIILLSMVVKSNAQVLSQLSFFAPLISTFDMKYINNHLLISQQGMKVVDVTDPFNPVQTATIAYPGSYAYQITAEGNHAYMAEGGGGTFAVYDISNMDAPVLSGSVDIPFTSFILGGDLAPHGDYVYMTGIDSLYTISVADSANPEVADVQQVTDAGIEGATAMKIIENSLFVVTTSALKIYDITNPVTPELITSLNYMHSNQSAIAADTQHHRIFLPWVTPLQDFLGYDAYDVSDPTAPVYLFSDSSSFSQGPYGVTNYHNERLFISAGGGLRVFDVADSSHQYMGSFLGVNVANSTVAIDIDDSLIFNARGSGVEILELTEGFPTAIAPVEEDGEAMGVYPNPAPAAGGFTVILSAGLDHPLLILRNIEGSIISVTASAIDANSLLVQGIKVPGLYLLTVQDHGKTFSQKILID